MTDPEDNINRIKLCRTTTIMSERWKFGANLFQIFNCVFVSTFCNFVDYLWLLLENWAFKNLWRIDCLGGNSVQCSRIYFTLTTTLNKLISTKIRVFVTLKGPSETRKSQIIHNWLKNGTIRPKIDKIYFFYQHSQTLHDVMQKRLKI